jgi:hypothetical protein
MTDVTLRINAVDMACLRQGLLVNLKDPKWELAVRVLDRLEDQAFSRMTTEQAREWVRVVGAPLALAATEARVKELEGLLGQVAQ